jgi:hypothetical protein
MRIDCKLYQGPNGRKDRQVFKALYGMDPGAASIHAVEALRVQSGVRNKRRVYSWARIDPTVRAMDLYATLISSKKGLPEEVKRGYCAFIQKLEESEYQSGFLEDEPQLPLSGSFYQCLNLLNAVEKDTA